MHRSPWPWLYLQADGLAGLSVAAMAVPQCVCFAGMAGLPANYGLYGVILPALGYSLAGSSPYLVQHNPAPLFEMPITNAPAAVSI